MGMYPYRIYCLKNIFLSFSGIRILFPGAEGSRGEKNPGFPTHDTLKDLFINVY